MLFIITFLNKGVWKSLSLSSSFSEMLQSFAILEEYHVIYKEKASGLHTLS